MSNSEDRIESLTFRGSMKAGTFTAQLGVRLHVTAQAVTLSASARTYQLDRVDFDGLEETSLLGIFKRGVVFRHRQKKLPANLVFYPSIGRDVFLERIKEFGWS